MPIITGTTEAAPSWRAKSQMAMLTSRIDAHSSWINLKDWTMRSTSVPMRVMAAESLTEVPWSAVVCRYIWDIRLDLVLVIRRYVWRQ